MEARRRLEFTGVELAGGEELAAPVEKATTDLMRVVTVLVEKVVRALENATADGAAEMEEGRQPLRATGAMKMEEGVRPCSGVVEMPAGGHNTVE
jgi:hypothetical protein